MNSEPKLIPRRVIFSDPDRITPQTSPDGTRFAYIAPYDRVPNVWVRTIGLNDDRAVTSEQERGIIYFFWSHDNRHLLYLQDRDGNENWHLFAVDTESNEVRDLTPFEGVQTQIVGRSKRHPGEILVALNRRDLSVHDVYRLELLSGTLRRVVENPGHLSGWVFDSDFAVRAALAARPDGGFDLVVREHEGAEWRTVVSWDMEDSLTSYPVSCSATTDSLYLIDSRGSGTSRLVRLDLATKKVETIAYDKHYDVSRIMIHPDTKKVQAISFQRARNEWQAMDSSTEQDFVALARLAHGDFYVYNRDDADRTWVVAYISDIFPVSFYAYKRNTGTAVFLFEHQPELRDYTLSEMKPISYEARDGLKIHGYLTLPPGKEPARLPLVLKVHSGPWTRDVWEFDPEVQWMVNRGYACMQVNFRGSTGYGKDFVNAGDREWGNKMQNDLVDAINWAVAQGIADPSRIAIYGLSYGGYAALVGVASTPHLFCCAVDIMGPSDLVSFIRDMPAHWSTYRHFFHRRVGNPEKDENFLQSRSPISMAYRIRTPLLVAHGTDDPRVQKGQSDRIVEAIRLNGVPCEYIVFDNEGHGLGNLANRRRCYAAVERFLARYLGGHCEEPA